MAHSSALSCSPVLSRKPTTLSIAPHACSLSVQAGGGSLCSHCASIVVIEILPLVSSAGSGTASWVVLAMHAGHL